MEVYRKIKEDLWYFCLLYLAIIMIWNWLPFNRDSTDGQHRSGMSLHIDDKTGCHYLSSSRGGIIKRYDDIGNHICTGEEDG